MLADVLAEPLQELAKEIGDAPRSPDRRDRRGRGEEAGRRTVARYGRVDAALLNAGIEGQVKPIESIRRKCSTR